MNGNDRQYARKCIELVLKVILISISLSDCSLKLCRTGFSDNKMEDLGMESPTRNFSIKNKLFNPTKTSTNKNL